MKILDLSFDNPQENLSCDETLLDACETGSGYQALRFWESKQLFVVLGVSGKIDEETNMSACQADKIPVLKRCSGGGTVLQGPGCLNYSLVLNIHHEPALKNVTSTNQFIMGRHRQAISGLLKKDVKVQGITDLALGNLKFSGNAQRRKKNILLFHGTFLLDFNIALIEKYLSMPERQPAYRQKRPHQLFLTNIDVSRKKLKDALIKTWDAA